MSVVGRLEGIEDVVESQSMIVIRKFTAFEEWHPGAFDDAATTVLRNGGAVTGYAHRDWVEPERLTPKEFEIARVLARDGRATYATVAARTGISESTAARRVESLVARGACASAPSSSRPVIGYDVEFLLWLTVEPHRLEEVGEKLAKHPSTRYVSACTGRTNLIVQGVLPGHGDLYHYTTHVIGELPGVVSADLTLQVQTLKRAWVPIDDDGRPSTKERHMTQEPWQWDEPTWRGHVARVRAGRPPDAAAVAGGRAGGRGASRSTPTTRRSPCATARRSPGKLAQGEYGSRVAAPRILRMLAEHDVPASLLHARRLGAAAPGRGRGLRRRRPRGRGPRLDPRAQHAARPRGRARPDRPRARHAGEGRRGAARRVSARRAGTSPTTRWTSSASSASPTTPR